MMMRGWLVGACAWLLVVGFPLASALAQTAAPESVAAGGRLYDKWWGAAPEVKGPADNHPVWASQTTNKRKGGDTWRCKECHGWDYKGRDGAYGKGSHSTGFPGVWDAAQKKSVGELVAILKGAANPKHDFSTVLKPADLTDAANFLKYGLIDTRKYVDYATQKPIGGDAARGKPLFALCAACHGPDGKKLNFGTDKKPEYVGTVAIENPIEFIHKVRVGQPGSNPPMLSMLVLGWDMQKVVDVLTYAQTLPEK